MKNESNTTIPKQVLYK